LVSLKKAPGMFSSVEKKRIKKINLHTFYIYRLDEQQNKLHKQDIFGDFVLQQIVPVFHTFEHRTDVVACLEITDVTYVI
jgi:hypothetical protein